MMFGFTFAVVAGLLPTALGVGVGGAQRSAIAVTIVGGQSLCLFLTLLLVPAVYVRVAAFEESFARTSLHARLARLPGLGRWVRPLSAK